MSAAPSNPSQAVVLLSGGLDSAVVLAGALADGFRCHALTIDYGQRHRVELDAAGRIARACGVSTHAVERLDLRLFGGSALTADIAVPKDRDESSMTRGVPVTYVPARNLIFLSLAAAYAEVLGAADLFIGVNAVDFSGYPDCRAQFIQAFERAANLATRSGTEGRPLRVRTPLIDLTKAQIVARGLALGVDFGLTHSCYDPTPAGRPCGRCDACLIRARGFREAGAADPTVGGRQGE